MISTSLVMKLFIALIGLRLYPRFPSGFFSWAARAAWLRFLLGPAPAVGFFLRQAGVPLICFGLACSAGFSMAGSRLTSAARISGVGTGLSMAGFRIFAGGRVSGAAGFSSFIMSGAFWGKGSRVFYLFLGFLLLRNRDFGLLLGFSVEVPQRVPVLSSGFSRLDMPRRSIGSPRHRQEASREFPPRLLFPPLSL